ncbi:MAG: FG-GAP repeat domain-containing protein [Thermoanaerobaculia bacterium]
MRKKAESARFLCGALGLALCAFTSRPGDGQSQAITQSTGVVVSGWGNVSVSATQTITISPIVGFGNCTVGGCPYYFTGEVGVPLTVAVFQGQTQITNGVVTWQVTSGSANPVSGSGLTFTFTPRRAGKLVVSATMNGQGVPPLTIGISGTSLGPEPGDFTGDGRASMAVYRPSTGAWHALGSGGTDTDTQWGASADVPVPADYDGDGLTNVAVFRPSTGVWYVRSSGSGYTETSWGEATDIPVPGDFDGDGKADLVMFRPTTGTWFVLNSSGGSTSMGWGVYGDTPVSGDFDGDGKADYAVVRESGGNMTWWVLKSSGGYTSYDAVPWGVHGDIPAPADYDGDGKTDIAIFRPSTGWWYIRRSSDGGVTARQWGVAGDIPQAADYDGDGKADIAVYRPNTGVWYVIKSSDGTVMSRSWGLPADVPVTTPRY